MRGPQQVVECSGSHHDMGRAQGAQAAREVAESFDRFFTGPEIEAARPWYVPRFLFPRLAVWRAARALRRPVEAAYPEHAERMEGIAAGAGADLRWLYLGVGAELMLNDVCWIPGACTAVAVPAARSATGEAMIAKNFDYPEPFRVGFCVRRNAPREGLRSIDVTVAPLAGCHSGVNEAGLAVTYNYGYGQDRLPSASPSISLLVGRMLERCATVEEAATLARTAPRSGGALLALADASGDAGVLELSPTRAGLRRDAGGVTCCANHYETPEVAPVDIPRDARYGARAVEPLRGEVVHCSSERRRADAERLSRGERLTVADLERLLSDHGGAPVGDDLSVCRHGPYFRTTCAVVLLPRQRRLRVLFGAPCQERFVEHGVDAPVAVGAAG